MNEDIVQVSSAQEASSSLELNECTLEEFHQHVVLAYADNNFVIFRYN